MVHKIRSDVEERYISLTSDLNNIELTEENYKKIKTFLRSL